MLRIPTFSLRCSVVTSLSLATLLLLSAGRARAAEPDFKAMMSKVGDAWETLDPAKAAVYYSKDAGAVFFDLAPLKYIGWNAYAAGTKGVFEGFSSLSLTMNDDAKIDRRGDVAITTATGRADVIEKSGSKMSFDWRWTLVWEKQKDNWLIVHEHLSAPVPMPEMPAHSDGK